MEAYLGQYVKTNNHSHRGRVTKKDHSFKSESELWFKTQKPALDPKTLDEPWYSILTVNGGSVYVPESDISDIEDPYTLNNPWESFYFSPF